MRFKVHDVCEHARGRCDERDVPLAEVRKALLEGRCHVQRYEGKRLRLNVPLTNGLADVVVAVRRPCPIGQEVDVITTMWHVTD